MPSRLLVVLASVCAMVLPLALALSVPLALAASTGSDPAATVRKMHSDGQFVCSAVVIAPGKALTAKHCIANGEGTHVDGKRIEMMRFSPTQDLAALEVPGLECPCAVVDRAPPAVKSTVRIVGYPSGVLEDIERVVLAVGPASDVFPELNVDDRPRIWTPPGIRMGFSGGGTFARRDGVWRLVGVNSVFVGPRTPFGIAIMGGGSEPLANTNIF